MVHRRPSVKGLRDAAIGHAPGYDAGMTATRLQTLLELELPIIQAPMAGAQGSTLAIAVSNGGGLGSLPTAMLALDTLREELARIRAQTTKPVNVNFFCHTPAEPNAEREAAWRAALSPYFAEHGIDPNTIPDGSGRAPFSEAAADVIAEFEPEVISFHFGLPSESLLARVRRWGARVLSSATTVAEARWLEARGVDAVIAQGLEAGGHRGHFLSDDLSIQLGTFALLPQIVDAVKIPVIAAGGIADARGVAAALALGASGVQVGTAYLLCPEATTSSVHRAALQSEAACITALTRLLTGRPARGIVNRLMRELGPMNPIAPAFPLASAAIAPLRASAERRGLADFSPLWAGQNVAGCKTMGAAALTRELASGLTGASRVARG
jgi:nitronate monooxygenase